MIANDSTYEAAKNAYTVYGWFLQQAASDLGWEKVSALHARVGDRMAGVIIMMLKARSGEHKLDTNCLSAVLDHLYKGFGMNYELRSGEDSVIGEYKRCPMYEGLSASGMEHTKIQKLCEAFAGHEAATLRQVFPELKLIAKFRECADKPCMEEFALGK